MSKGWTKVRGERVKGGSEVVLKGNDRVEQKS